MNFTIRQVLHRFASTLQVGVRQPGVSNFAGVVKKPTIDTTLMMAAKKARPLDKLEKATRKAFPLDKAETLARLDRKNPCNPANVELLKCLSLTEREEFARETKTLVLYFGAEVPIVQKAEEDAALSAAPGGHDICYLNGLNIGCGDRTISPYLLPVDIMRRHSADDAAGAHHALTENALLALSDNLPFKESSLDYIVALHMLEHVADPVGLIRYWLKLVKPGGGIGIVVPDWRYTWDARFDGNPLGHKWNPTPDLIKSLYLEHWSDVAALERLDTYPYRISIDFVLRKHGTFVPFSIPDKDTFKSGVVLRKVGQFLHGE